MTYFIEKSPNSPTCTHRHYLQLGCPERLNPPVPVPEGAAEGVPSLPNTFNAFDVAGSGLEDNGDRKGKRRWDVGAIFRSSFIVPKPDQTQHPVTMSSGGTFPSGAPVQNLSLHINARKSKSTDMTSPSTSKKITRRQKRF